MLCLFKVGKLGVFLAHGLQYRRVGLVYLVTSSQCFIHMRNKHKQRVLSFFTECLIRVLFLDVKSKVRQKMAELCTKYPFLSTITRSE